MPCTSAQTFSEQERSTHGREIRRVVLWSQLPCVSTTTQAQTRMPRARTTHQGTSRTTRRTRVRSLASWSTSRRVESRVVRCHERGEPCAGAHARSRVWRRWLCARPRGTPRPSSSSLAARLAWCGGGAPRALLSASRMSVNHHPPRAHACRRRRPAQSRRGTRTGPWRRPSTGSGRPSSRQGSRCEGRPCATRQWVDFLITERHAVLAPWRRFQGGDRRVRERLVRESALLAVPIPRAHGELVRA